MRTKRGLETDILLLWLTIKLLLSLTLPKITNLRWLLKKTTNIKSCFQNISYCPQINQQKQIPRCIKSVLTILQCGWILWNCFCWFTLSIKNKYFFIKFRREKKSTSFDNFLQKRHCTDDLLLAGVQQELVEKKTVQDHHNQDDIFLLYQNNQKIKNGKT